MSICENMKMSKCDNIFERVQKRTPFRTPEGFFEQQEQTLKQTVRPIESEPAVRPLHHVWYYGIVAAIILLLAIYPVMRLVHRSSSSRSVGEGQEELIYTQSTSSDDWADFADADIFMDNMNW